MGRALEKQSRSDEAIEAYKKAANIKPDDELAWKGLCNVYESQGAKGVEGFTTASVGLAQRYIDKDDRDQCQTVVDKAIGFAKEHGSRKLYKQALRVLLPNGPVFDFLEGRVQPPDLTFTRLAELTEVEEKETISKEVGERRTRLGAKVGQVTLEVKREVFTLSELETLYQGIVDWTQDDDVRREYEEKIFRRAYEHLEALPSEEKGSKRDQVMRMARDMVIIKHPFELAWDTNLEWQDFDSFSDLDTGVLREYISFFPTSGISKTLQAHLGELPRKKATESSAGNAQPETGHDGDRPSKIGAEDRLVLLTDGLNDSRHSAFAHRVGSDYFRAIDEHESCAECSRKGLGLSRQEAGKSGLHFQRNEDAFNINLASSLVYYQAPKNHPEAKDIFNEILKRKETQTDALLGLGLILEEQEDFGKASSFLEQASSRDPDNVQISSEAAWCRVLTGDVSGGLGRLESALQAIEKTEMRELRALLLYRIGRSLWILKTDKASRRDRNGPYARFIASLRANPNYAPAYTSLGVYYADCTKDKKRARQCFQKAFELSALEVEAAERLARAFADDGDWDIVEIIAQRVVDSGVARPAPGSKKKGLSWPFSALGIVQMNKQDYPRAVNSFQAALRIAPNDYFSWVGLGESYHSSGRYIAAQRTLDHAKTLARRAHGEAAPDSWFAEYMLSNVLRELGTFDEAITGYEKVLIERPTEFGLSLALLQTFVDRAYHSVNIGFFGLAASSANSVLDRGRDMLRHSSQLVLAFNFWKCIADALAIFLYVPGTSDSLALEAVRQVVLNVELPTDETLDPIDQISQKDLRKLIDKEDHSLPDSVSIALSASIIAYKHAIAASSNDIHAQAVAWYNLGWAEYLVAQRITHLKHLSVKPGRLSRAAVRCFKRAIELEAGNAEFWNALGVSTANLNPKVAQHAFVRSLHLNERSAQTWTNFGALCLLQLEIQLAYQAFGRAQSTDPDYPYAWVGHSLIATQLSLQPETLSHCEHAQDISDDAAVIVKHAYTVASFDALFSFSETRRDAASLVPVDFALRQLTIESPFVNGRRHLLGLIQERLGDFDLAITNLEASAASAEADFERSEALASMRHFATAKADLARVCLANEDFPSAYEHAEAALDLTSDVQSSDLDEDQRPKLRLSAQLTAGLARYFTDALDESIAMFREALSESSDSPDVVCLLAQLLWAKGGKQEKDVARDQLFECIEKHPGHAQATSLIGAMAAIDDDEATLDAVTEDLQALRTSDKLDRAQRRQLDSLVASIATVGSGTAAADPARVSVMLSPEDSGSWSQLAAAVEPEEPSIFEMVAMTATQAVPPYGNISATQLSQALAASGEIAKAQRATLLCPWESVGWEALAV